MTHTFNLTAVPHRSAVLDRWMASRAGAHARVGKEPDVVNVEAFGENSVNKNLTADELARALGAASSTASGIAVDEDIAMKVSTVYGCVNLVAGAISTLPLPIYERNGRKEAEDHPYHWMLNEQANEEITSCTALEFLLMSRMLYGDGFGELLRPSIYSSRVIGWKPHHPRRVQPFRDGDGRLRYRITPDQGRAQYVLDPADMIHVPSLGFDGLRSPSPITHAAREAVGTAIAAEEFTSRFFSQGATFDIALKTDKQLKQEQADDLRTSFLARNGGSRNNRIPLILTGGLDVEKLSITPQDAALLPSRMFTVEELCRIFGVPPFMVGHTDKVSAWGSGVEQMGIGFVKYTLRRHLGPVEQEFNRKLWPSRSRYFVEFNTAALERGDFKTRMEGYRIGLGRAGEPGWLTPNEIRKFENLPPVEGGDERSNGVKDAGALPKPKKDEDNDQAAAAAR